MNKDEFEKDLEIDVENLDVEAIRQPQLYFKYASAMAEAREEYDLAKLKLAIVESEIARKVRLKPNAFGVSKITESSIREATTVHPRYRSAYKKMVHAKATAETINQAQNSMEQKKRSLEMLVTLNGREWFSSPSAPRSPQELWKRAREKKEEQTHETMIKQTRKRKRKNHDE